MGINNPAERQFYETEAASERWSLREMKRQFNSALYERLALSRDKKAVTEMSQKGQIIERPEDIVKDPYILEFLGLKEDSSYSESDLEQRIIDETLPKDNTQIFASNYELVLPDKEALMRLLVDE